MPNLADSNFWLAATLSKHVFHASVRGWLASRPEDEEVGFCRSTQQTYLRLLTTREVLAPYGNAPLTNAAAWEKYEAWHATELVCFLSEPPGLEAHWRRLGAAKTASPKLWMDAYLAAFAIAGGHRLVTTDKAFRQFKGLDCVVLGA